ncbi:MAG: polyphosphate kinase 2 family protein [Pyrinomonadaceae bacterium]|jgi:PPK2 family polyphosphate:nucleotide phosphotransferase|nr:polyphosphate kinase 2 family protein [Pyrinomonadaceae bacterium]
MKTKQFLVAEGKKLNLKKHKTDSTGDYKAKEEAVADLQKNVERLAKLQDILYAQNHHALLIIVQALDAAGKDGLIKHVMTGLNPQGCQVFSFKAPSSEELDHDFLWRASKSLPERGRLGIFNRSYYEEVLVVRVHPSFLQNQPLPSKVKADKKVWEKRFEDIKNFEKYLSRNGVHVLKFFLNVSKDEQKKRFLERIETPEKNWKFSAQDVKERGFWDDYQKVYTEAMEATSTEKSPWYVIPADNKWFTRVAVSEIICEKLESLGLEYPKLSEAQMAELAECKKILESEK